MSAVDGPGALADPEHVGRAVVPGAGEGVLTGEGLLVTEEQRLVGGVEVHLVKGGRLHVDAARLHEAQGALDLGRDGLVAPALGARGHELLVPGMDLAQVGEAPLGEGPQQVQRGRRLVVGGEEPLRVGRSGRGSRHEVVHAVAAEGREVLVTDPLGGRRSGLGELPGDAAHLHDRHARAVGEHHRHLEDDLELVPDGVGGEVVEGLGAVARLEHEGSALGHLGQAGSELAGLPGEDQRGQRREVLQCLLEDRFVRPVRLLVGRPLAPGSRCPLPHGLQRRGVTAPGRNTGSGRAPRQAEP